MTTYYIDNDLGSNSNPGTLAAPWLDWTNVAAVATGNTFLVNGSGTALGPLALTSKSNVTIGTYGVGLAPVVGSGSACIQLTSCSNITMFGLDCFGGTNGVNIITSGTGIVFRYGKLRDNTNNGFNVPSGASGDALIEYVEVSANANDGLGSHGSFAMTVRGCSIHGHNIGAQSDGVTDHETAVTVIEDCEIYGNHDGVNLTSTAAGSRIERCFIHDNDEVGINLTAASMVTPRQIKACIIEMPSIAASTTACISVAGGDNVEIDHCTFRNAQVGATTNHCLYITSTGKAGWKNCRFLTVNDNESRCVRCGTSPLAQVTFADYNFYPINTGVKFNVPANASYAAWQLLTDISLNLLDVHSVNAADADSQALTTKAAARLSAANGSVGVGTATGSTVTHDAFGRAFSSVRDIGAAQRRTSPAAIAAMLQSQEEEEE